MNSQVVFGTSVINNQPPSVAASVLTFPGKTMHGGTNFQVNADILSRHIMLLGGAGCGKTNVFFYAIDELQKRITKNDIVIVFDTKGEFYEKFFRPGDYVIGNGVGFKSKSYTWNIFEEILADGWNESDIMMNTRELSAALFHGRGSKTQPFFANAAKDIFRGILFHFVRQAKENPAEWSKKLNNADLIKALNGFQIEHYIKIFGNYPDLRGLLTYFGDGTSGQALGVFGELNSMISEYFVGILTEYRPDKTISMRKAVREKGGKKIFVEYDLAVGETLTPIYRLLIDQALKEALSRTADNGNVYIFADEFKLLPKLQHIDDALNFGRGLGIKVMAGIQSIDQLYDVYGKEKGAVIAGGFGSVFTFHTNDGSSRKYITERFGSNITVYEYNNIKRNAIVCNEREGKTVEDWDQLSLALGQAIIGLGYDAPFLFQFSKYEK